MNENQFVKEDKDIMVFTNSQLVDYTRISPNKTINRSHVIDTITIHCFVGQVTVERGCEVFAPTSRQASCNYVVAKDGKIGLVVEEKDRSWCSSNFENDNRAITIEVASDNYAPYAVTDAALNSLIRLCADICKRNNIDELRWQGDKKLIGQLDKQNMTVHRWFANKACPGDYLYSRHGYIAAEVNKLLNSDMSSGKISVSRFTPAIGNRPQWEDLIRNLKLAINTDFGTKMITTNAQITNDLCIHLGNIQLNKNVPVHNVIYVLQQILVWWGFKVELTGNYDDLTANVVAQLQMLTRLQVTKTTTKETWLKLIDYK